MKRKIFAFTLIAALVISSFAGCGGGSGTVDPENFEPVELRLSSDAPIEHLASDLNKAACEEVAKRTEGRVTIKYFPASQLGGYDTVYEEVMRGSIDMAQISFATSVDQRLSTFNFPALTTGYDEAKKVYAADSFMSQTYRDLCGSQNVEFLGWVLEGFMGLGMVKTPTDALTPGASKKVQVRVWGSPICIEPMSDLGFTTVTVPYAEVPIAIQTGVVDGWIGGTPNMNYVWVGEIINEFYVNYLYAETTAYLISMNTMKKLLPEDQEIIRQVFKEQSEESFLRAEENDEMYLEKLTNDHKVKVVRYSQEEIQAQADFIRENTWPKLEPVVGKDILDGLKAELSAL